jgi:FKBP-type peptidyl-prolyl cis-trans isomerase SlpA
MRPVQPGDRVQVHYVKRLQDGSVRSSREPLELTVGIHHPRLPGLGAALVGLTPGQVTTVTVPPERAYGRPNPARVRRCSRRRFPGPAALEPGQLVRLADAKGRRRLVRILELRDKVVVVDCNHPWAGQVLQLEVRLVAIRGAAEGLAGTGGERAPRVVAFDVDAASLASLREALPGWEVVALDGASMASVAHTGDPGPADLLIVGARENGVETLGLCRMLACCTPHATEVRHEVLEALFPRKGARLPVRAGAVPLLVLVRPGQQTLAGAALEAGASSCLILPLHAREVAGMLAQARAGNRPGRHTGDLDRAQVDGPWQEDGGEA